MFLRKNHSLKSGRTYLSIVKGYRDSAGKNRHKTIRKVGYLDILEKEYDDHVSYFEQIDREMTFEEKEKNKHVTLSI